MSEKFQIGSLVWAKMKGFSPWPGLVSKPKEWVKKPAKKTDFQCIYFFGTKNYAWIEESNIMPYLEFKHKLINSCKSVSFKEAVNEIEDFLQRVQSDPNFNVEQFDVEKEQDTTFDRIKEDVKPPSAKKKKESTGANKRASTNTPGTAKSAKKRKTSTAEENGSISPVVSNHGTKNYEELLNRPLVDRAKSPSLDIHNISDNFRSKKIEASSKTFGFIGLGIMGSGIVKNLIISGHKVNLWNRTARKAEVVKEQADLTSPGQVKTWSAPCDVVYNSDIIFSCVSDTRAAKNIVFTNCGVLYQQDGYSLEGKGYVELTSIDTETSKDINNVITSKGGRYLEAQLQGSKHEADNGSLIVLGAGDKTLFDDCQTCFQAMGKTAFYLGDVGYATKMNLILQVMRGISLAGLTEGFVLADRSGLSLKDVLEIFSITSMSSPALVEKANIIINQDFRNPRMPLQHMQKDLKLALELSDSLQQPLLLAATANEVFKHARRLGYDKHDSAAVYMRARH
ncbi:hypothetical protein RN001_004026 [Aquatica leii]|uniref:Cytokine-like nuclear factor N-PAC n=1 Tax=Aquatica leii TaxID=1421715 RepID=A0AAN7PGL1_9COLE|nr:hypothetical protein RN001_004026 [Aquatica leii]